MTGSHRSPSGRRPRKRRRRTTFPASGASQEGSWMPAATSSSLRMSSLLSRGGEGRAVSVRPVAGRSAGPRLTPGSRTKDHARAPRSDQKNDVKRSLLLRIEGSSDRRRRAGFAGSVSPVPAPLPGRRERPRRDARRSGVVRRPPARAASAPARGLPAPPGGSRERPSPTPPLRPAVLRDARVRDDSLGQPPPEALPIGGLRRGLHAQRRRGLPAGAQVVASGSQLDLEALLRFLRCSAPTEGAGQRLGGRILGGLPDREKSLQRVWTGH